MAKISAPAVLTIIALAGALLAGCAGLHPADEVNTRPATAAAEPATSGGDAQAETPASAGGSAAQAPASRWLDVPEQVPPPSDYIDGYAVPAIVTEPAVTYVTPPDSHIPAGLTPGEVPTPKRPRPRAMGWVDPASVTAAEALGTEEPAGDRPAGGGPTKHGAGSGEAIHGAGSNWLGGPSTPAFTTTFDSLDFDDNVPNTSGGVFIPPDSSGAAGSDHVVSVTNVSIQAHDKDGTALFGATGMSLNAFFTALGCPPVIDPPLDMNYTFDPKVLFDQHADRFLVVTLEREDSVALPPDTTDDSRILLAVSATADPTGPWFCTAIASKLMIGGTDHWADYPGFAIDEEAVYITANMFEFATSGGAFGGTRLWVVDKGDGSGGFYDGGTASVSLLDPYGANPTCAAVAPFCGTTQPAHIYGTPSTSSPNIGTWLSYFSGLSAFGLQFIQVMRLDDPLGTPTFVGPSVIGLGTIDDVAGALPDAPQMGSAETIETNDRRTLDSVWQDDSLYVTTTIDPETGDPGAGQATAHWIQLGTTPIGLIDQGDIDGEDIAVGTHTFFPSIAVTSANDVAIGFSASGSLIFPSAAYTVRGNDDAAGTHRGSVVLASGAASYIRTFDAPPCATPAAENRWGDYSAAALDPTDECFWIYNEYALTTGTGTTGGCNGRPDPEEGRWGTKFGRSCICSESVALSLGDWRQISMSCDQTEGNRTLGEVFGDDLDGVYETDWIVKHVDPVTGINITPALTDPLEIGKGYWIKTNMSAQMVENEGIDNEEVEFPLEAADTDGTGCGTSAGLCNMVGHPHKFDVCWADIEWIDGGSSLDLATADPASACQGASAVANGCIASRVAYKFLSGAYAPFDGTTPGMEGTLKPWDGFWVSAAKDDLKIKIPATTSNCGAPELGDGWFIRLIATSGDLEDPANVFGQLADSVDGYDSHDLLDLPPLSPYLTVAFPHPDWGDHADDYTSDYHALRLESEPDAWTFEVRSSDPAAEVTLRWEGPESRLLGSILTDLETGEEVAVAPDGSYTFTMSGPTRSFHWGYLTPASLIFADGFESGDTSAW